MPQRLQYAPLHEMTHMQEQDTTSLVRVTPQVTHMQEHTITSLVRATP